MSCPIRVFGLCSLVFSLCAFPANRREIQLYHGLEAHTIRTIPYTRPPFVSLMDLLKGLGLKYSVSPDKGEYHILKKQTLVLDRVSQKAYLGQESFPLSFREEGGLIYARVDDLNALFSRFLSKPMIYEPTSRTIHVSHTEELRVDMRIRPVDSGFRLVLLYSNPLETPLLKRSDRNLLIKLKAKKSQINRSELLAHPAIESVDVVQDLPDGTTEILIKPAIEVSNFRFDAAHTQDQRTSIKLEGAFMNKATLRDNLLRNRKEGLHCIVIDPGHGGGDQGAAGPTGLLEKDVTLSLVKELRQLLATKGTYRIELTREDDTFLNLKTRTGIANNHKADLFLSIHVNAIRSQNATGSETYYLSPNQAELEFDQDHYGSGSREPHHAQDGDLNFILWDMAQTKHLDDSFRIASYIQDELNLLAGIRSRGVKQAPLKVLKGALMPAVLVEVAFISNSQEEAKLRKKGFRTKIVESIARAIDRYDQDIKKRSATPEGSPIKGGR